MLGRKYLLALVLTLPISFSLGASCNSNSLNGGNNDGGGTDDGGNSGPMMVPGCVGSCVVKYDCPVAMGPTTISGTVKIPAGTLPLYNAKVYIPTGNAIPDPPMTGASCDRCDAEPVGFSTTTDVNGNFTLKNIPSGGKIPLIVRVGKWRRVITLPDITDCTTTAIPAEMTRLPKNQSEGNIPKIALSTGALDAMECILRSGKLGLDPSEFTLPSGNGRVNLYAGITGTDQYADGTLFPTSNPWWDTAANLNKYDIIMLSCEGEPDAFTATHKSAAARQNLQSYLGVGGRVFASHWHNVWITRSNPPPGEPSMNTVAGFVDYATNTGYSNDNSADEATINTSFPKGLALQQWLQNSAGLNANGKLDVNFVRVTLTKMNNSVTPAKTNPDPNITQSWITLTKTANALDSSLANPPSQYFSFNLPLSQPPSNQCGQMVFTDLHVSGGPGGDKSKAGTTYAFPNGCTTTGLSPQEKALIFLLFDLTNCLQPPIG